ncbi:hypothetical protein BDR03DRAFT_691709 [Suillus americanus]|nr:hypothetical protein BDR03DRAFT_691709 [Suillus americanus]
MRFDSMNPQITIGALDPNYYQDHINWVPSTTLNITRTFQNTFMIDGLKWYNGSFLPENENLLAVFNSLDRNFDAKRRYTPEKSGFC